MFRKTLLLGSTALLLAACGDATEETADETNGTDEETTEESGNGNGEEVVIEVASHLPPMTDIVEIAGDVIENGYSVELVEVSDNIQYNEALLNDEVDASFAQHEPFMEMFNTERDGNLVAIQPIYNAIVGFYSPVYGSIDDIEEGAEVALPSDPSNEARALMILDHYDLITLSEDVSFEATVNDIEENPYDLTFTSIDLLNLSAAYEDGVELVFNYPTYIESVGLTPEDALILEDDEDFTFAIQLVAREDNQDSDAIQALKDAFTSQEVYDFLDDLAENGHLEPAFEVNN
ncbi:MetQ/NlpA family ABC transporter substrate-binding protein [Alkalibacterium pelagium]|jgi:D-methionine transport system substrate-binding protein|uniref:D-methionine transport system substrate-binding protein n=1 Tax=Alkalibacterium pelagium TaxID=426702 RepID=A0A1H7J1A0_9LACT|nr:MetQ/NlpA family ABC transporter substrate-binding protein [Alkalibacterium pelagium]GEN50288.1 membrane protein [Alkalibacterium pelagium]SEK67982.1 D-methionine transport system substrate-binding protein [Alkalibacterium pelagium]